MKNLFKSIIAAILVAVIAISSFGTETAQAAETPVIKITFNKKSVKLKVTDTGVKEVKYSTLKKKLGKATKVDDESNKSMDYYYTVYMWKKGKSQFSYSKESLGTANLYAAIIEDKNVSICGVTKGTKANKAKKAFEKAGATVTGNKEYMDAKFNDRCTIECNIENGKISVIYAKMYY